jgi:hypothetical protein
LIRHRHRPFAAAVGVLVLAAPWLGQPALASSPAAWAEYDRKVRSACHKASGLAEVRVRGQRLDLPTLGLSTLLQEGRARQPFLAGQRVQELCVYQQSSGQAEVGDAERLRGAPPAASRPGAPGSAGPGSVK